MSHPHGRSATRGPLFTVGAALMIRTGMVTAIVLIFMIRRQAFSPSSSPGLILMISIPPLAPFQFAFFCARRHFTFSSYLPTIRFATTQHRAAARGLRHHAYSAISGAIFSRRPRRGGGRLYHRHASPLICAQGASRHTGHARRPLGRQVSRGASDEARLRARAAMLACWLVIRLHSARRSAPPEAADNKRRVKTMMRLHRRPPPKAALGVARAAGLYQAESHSRLGFFLCWSTTLR